MASVPSDNTFHTVCYLLLLQCFIPEARKPQERSAVVRVCSLWSRVDRPQPLAIGVILWLGGSGRARCAWLVLHVEVNPVCPTPSRCRGPEGQAREQTGTRLPNVKSCNRIFKAGFIRFLNDAEDGSNS
ncbi:hypothetical protein AGIG_G18290 [Arapaima gigas]